jgi:hypothetical protein
VIGQHRRPAPSYPFRRLEPGRWVPDLADDGQWLLGQLVPKGAKPEQTGPSDDVIVRNRLWTELNRRYDDLYKAGVEVWGRRQVDAYMPTLLTRVVTKSEPEQAPTTGG